MGGGDACGGHGGESEGEQDRVPVGAELSAMPRMARDAAEENVGGSDKDTFLKTSKAAARGRRLAVVR